MDILGAAIGPSLRCCSHPSIHPSIHPYRSLQSWPSKKILSGQEDWSMVVPHGQWWWWAMCTFCVGTSKKPLGRLFFTTLLRSALSFHSNKGSGIHFCVHTDWSRASVISPRKRGKSCYRFNRLSTYSFLK